MNRPPDVDLVLRAYLADDGLPAPDRVLTDVERRIGRQPQRRAWPFPGRTIVTTQTKLLAGLAAALVIAVAGYTLLPKSGMGQPGATPTPTVAPSPTNAVGASLSTIVCEEGTSGCAGPIAAGPHQSVNFRPSIEYTTPDGWINTIDTGTQFAVTPSVEAPHAILVLSGVVPADKGADCLVKAKAGVGSTMADWMAYLSSHPGLDAENAQSLSIGGRSAKSIDIQSFGGWTSPCVSDQATFNVSIFKQPDGSLGDAYRIEPGMRYRVYAVDLAASTIIVIVDSFSGDSSALPTDAALAEPIVRSLTFAP